MNSKVIISIIALILAVGIGTGILIYNNGLTDSNTDSNNSDVNVKNNLTINNTTESENNNNNTTENNIDSTIPNDSKMNISSDSKNNNEKQVKTQNTKKTRLSESQVIKISNRIMKKNSDYDSSEVKVSKIDYTNGIWFVYYKNIKTGKKVGSTAISDKTGELATL